MNVRQRILSWFYPVLLRFQKKSSRGGMWSNEKGVQGITLFYTLQAQQSNGSPVDFMGFKGKKVLIVNTASNCGYTRQYQSLQKLYEYRKDDLVVLAFPSNDFKEQEKGTDAEVQAFCEINYGVNFPIMKKSSVIKGQDQNVVFQWLSQQSQNGWNDRDPIWNFTKYLIDEQGKLMSVFGPAIDPESLEFRV